jgi:hypothetical protein
MEPAMSDWGWVALAYAVAYGTLAAFIVSITWRIRSSRQRLEALASEQYR